MRVRFWGTRGSIPVATTSAAIRHKLVAALTPAAGRAARHPGPHRGVRRQRARLRGRGTRSAATRRASSSTPADPTTCCATSAAASAPSAITRWPRRRGEPAVYHVFMSHTALGPHHGVPVLHARVHAGQRHHDLRLPRMAGGGDPAPARRAVVSGGVLPAAAPTSASCASSPAAPTTSPASG